jgi:peptidyl-prolyl cis-trans isomerase A (cyclophilin A)
MKAMRALKLILAGALSCTFSAVPVLAQTNPAAKKPPSTTTTQRRTQMGTDPGLMNPALLHARAPEVYDVKFATTKGDFVVRVTRAWAPLGADRFYNLVNHHFYDNASFFRVLTGFVVQFGIHADPRVSHVWSSAVIKDDRVTQSNKRGTLTFATAGPNTRTTQVFINLGNNGPLDAQGFSPFGEVSAGMDVVDKLYSGYGEGAPGGKGPRQDLIESKGKPYLDQDFPKLDSIKTAAILPAATSAAPAGKPAAKP